VAICKALEAFGNSNDAESEWAHQFESVNELLHGRGALIDMIWMTFINLVFDGNDETETDMFRVFVEALVAEYPKVRRSASVWIARKIAEISRSIGATYTEDEAESKITDLRKTEVALKVTDKLFTAENIVIDGMKVAVNSAREALVRP
jgi:hypothetical protein